MSPFKDLNHFLTKIVYITINLLMSVFDARLTDVNLSWNKNTGTNDYNVNANNYSVKTKEMSETTDNAWSKCYRHNAKFTLSIFTLILLIVTHICFFALYPLWILVSMNIVLINPALIIYVCTDSQPHIILLHFCAFVNFLNYIQHEKDLKYLYFVISSVIAIHILCLRLKHKLPIAPTHYIIILINITCAVIMRFVPALANNAVGFDLLLLLLLMFNVVVYYLYKSTQEAQSLTKS